MKRKIFTAIGLILATFISAIIICDQSVAYNAKERLYNNVDSIPHRKVGLILGTSPISTWNGRRNYYFDHRIKAGAELYKAGKVDWLVVSGGDYRNTENGYDEPVAMRDSLMKLYESQGTVTFGNFIDALLAQGVKEALYTDMGQRWNYCFYRVNQSDKTPNYLHSTSLPYASNFIVIKTK